MSVKFNFIIKFVTILLLMSIIFVTFTSEFQT